MLYVKLQKPTHFTMPYHLYIHIMLVSGEHRPLARRMSAPGLTSEAQLRYLLEWFGEFSELQREDFLPILAAARADKPDILAASLARLSCQDKPVSLFQCRVSTLLNQYLIHEEHFLSLCRVFLYKGNSTTWVLRYGKPIVLSLCSYFSECYVINSSIIEVLHCNYK